MGSLNEVHILDVGLEGRGAIVATANKGLGRGLAEDPARQAVNVAIWARTASDLEEAATPSQKSAGREVLHQEPPLTR